MSQKIQFRRGVEAQRALVTPDLGEPLFTTDTKQLFIGDGATVGGVAVGGNGGGSSGFFVQKICGTQAITSGADAVTVSGLGLATVPGQVLVTVRKATGGLNLFATVRGDSITTAGFTVDLSGATDASTYRLDWLAIL
jgi:Major tropism determinant N-terminal domain